MPNNINLKADLSTLDFSQVGRLTADDAQAQALFNKPGKISLDDKGELFVINPNAKRNNAFVRFFKGILTRNKAYMNEQHAIDRYEKLKNNASFADKAAKELINAASANKANADVSADDLAFTALRNLQIKIQPNSSLTTDMLQQALAKSENTHSSLADLKDSFELISQNDLRNSLIYCDGKILNAQELCQQYAQDKSIPNPLKLGTAVIHALAYNNGDEISQFISDYDQMQLNSLLAKDTKWSKEERSKFSEIVSQAFHSFEHKLSSLAKEAVSEHKDPQAVASLIADAYNIVASERDGSLAFEQVFGDGDDSIKNQIEDLGDNAHIDNISSAQRTALDEVKANFPDLTDKQCAQILVYCEKNNMPLSEFAKFGSQWQTVTALVKTYTKIAPYFQNKTQDSQAPLEIVKFLNNMETQLNAALHSIGINISGGGEYSSIAKIAAFMQHITNNDMTQAEFTNLSYIAVQLRNYAMENTAMTGKYRQPQNADPDAEMLVARSLLNPASILEYFCSSTLSCAEYKEYHSSQADPRLNELLTKVREHINLDLDVPDPIGVDDKGNVIYKNTQSHEFQLLSAAVSSFPEDIQPQVKSYLKAVLHKAIDGGLTRSDFEEKLNEEIRKLNANPEFLQSLHNAPINSDNPAEFEKSVLDALLLSAEETLRYNSDFEEDDNLAGSFIAAVKDGIVSVNGFEATAFSIKDDLLSLNIPEEFLKSISLLAGKQGLLKTMPDINGFSLLSKHSASQLLNDSDAAIAFEQSQPKIDISFDSLSGKITLTYTVLNSIENHWDNQSLCKAEASAVLEINTREGVGRYSWPDDIHIAKIARKAI